MLDTCKREDRFNFNFNLRTTHTIVKVMRKKITDKIVKEEEAKYAMMMDKLREKDEKKSLLGRGGGIAGVIGSATTTPRTDSDLLLDAEENGDAPYVAHSVTAKGEKRPLTPRLFTPRSNASTEQQNDDFSPA